MPAHRVVLMHQLELLVEFMETHREFANYLPGKMESSDRTSYNRNLTWQHLANKLNHVKTGVIKSAKDWSKYWNEQKYKAKKKMRYLKRLSPNSMDATGKKPLTDLEWRILVLLGEISAFDEYTDGNISKLAKVENSNLAQDDSSSQVPQMNNEMHEVFLPSATPMSVPPSEEKSYSQEPSRERSVLRVGRRFCRRPVTDSRSHIFHERRLAVESQVAQALTQLAANVAALNDNLAGIRAALEAD